MKAKTTTMAIAAGLLAAWLGAAWAADATSRPSQPASRGPATSQSDKVRLPLELPKPRFEGTPKNLPAGTTVDPNEKLPPFYAPRNVQNVALHKTVTSSDPALITGELKMITDGDKEAQEGSFVELRPGRQWVQVDLGKEYPVYAVAVWHYHLDARVYHDVVVQLSDDADFVANVRTVYNDDQDNSSGLGLGKDREYFETFRGRVIDCKGQKARYVRCYSKGSTADDFNHYTEIEVYALQGK